MMEALVARYLLPVVAVAALLGGGWLYLHNLHSDITDLEGQVQTQTDRANLAVHVAASSTATTQIVTKTVEKVVEVKVKGDTIVQKVPVYVTQKADANCVVPLGAVSVLNAAARNVLLPGSAGAIQEAPSGVALSTVTGTAAEWAGRYWQLAAEYDGFLEWVETQGALARGGGLQQK
jgi:hypothetical protein